MDPEEGTFIMFLNLTGQEAEKSLAGVRHHQKCGAFKDPVTLTLSYRANTSTFILQRRLRGYMEL